MALFWPTIRNEADLEYVTRQGLWICFVIAAVTVVMSAFTGSLVGGVFEGAFFFLAGLGVRERNRVAGVAAFSTYFLSALVSLRYGVNGFGVMSVVSVIFLALLFANVRGSWVAATWERGSRDAVPILKQTWSDKLSNQLPAVLWPKVRFLFYVLAGMDIALLLLWLIGSRAVA